VNIGVVCPVTIIGFIFGIPVTVSMKLGDEL
jgi:hypothetical protein